MQRSWTSNRLLLAVATLSLASPASAGQDCICGGTPTAQPHKGGDGQPLKWEYEQFIVQPASGSVPQLVCYHKKVENDGSADVRDVGWEVANFLRPVIRKGDLQASCPTVSGEVNPKPTNGPLHYGPGADVYDATVFQPQSQTASRNNDAPPEIRTALSFDMLDAKDAIVSVGLNFLSEAKSDGKSSSLSYLVQNESALPLFVLVNVTASKSILEKIPMIQKQLRLDPGDKRSFETNQEGAAVIEPGLIVVYDLKGRVQAFDSAGFHTIPGDKPSDSSFWGVC